jgi:hypothetical protein
MQRTLLISLLATAAFASLIASPANALEKRFCQERSQTLNKTETMKAHRQRHREQVLNKQAVSHQETQQQAMNKHVCY